MKKNPIIILSGPTASGKSDMALSVAKKIDAVIINCDSKQLYKEIPIITAQPSADEQKEVPHELYGVISAAEDCSVGRWLGMAKEAIDKVHASGKTPVLVGGTGMYIKSLTEGIAQIPKIDEDLREQVRKLVEKRGSEAVHAMLAKDDQKMATKLKPRDRQRVARAYEVLKQTGKSLSHWQQQKSKPAYPPEDFKKFFLNLPREQVYKNCENRFEKMLDAGLIEEIKALDAMNLNPELPSMRAHGVPEILAYLHGDMSLDEACDQAKRNTRHYIKRQFTWFRHQMSDTIAIDRTDSFCSFL